MKQIQADVAVIGGGSAGMSAFRQARRHSDNVYLIEAEQFGTTCARVGCMPSKLLIAAAEARRHALNAEGFGIRLDKQSVRVDGEAVMARVKAERDRFVGFVLDDVNAWPEDKKITGHARFLDVHTLDIGGHTRLTAKAFVIATGSRPTILQEWRQLGDRLITNDDVFSWDRLPERVAVFGTGVIGLELGQALAQLGVEIAVFGRSGRLAGISDPVVQEEAARIFAADFPLYLNAQTETALAADGRVEVKWRTPEGSGTFYADYLLAAIGRRPNTDNIGLERLAMETDEKGVPVADPLTMQTGIPHIFIAGDASDQLPLLHEAADQGKIAGQNAALFPNIQAGLRRSRISVVFTHPQTAAVGSRFADLPKVLGADWEERTAIGAVSFQNQGRSRVMRVNQGLLRLYADKQNGRFLGAEMTAPAAEHLAHLLAWAHQMRMTVAQMLDMPFYHPVIEEGLRTALRDAVGKLADGS